MSKTKRLLVSVASDHAFLREELVYILEQVGEFQVESFSYDGLIAEQNPSVVVCIIKSTSDAQSALSAMAKVQSGAMFYWLFLDRDDASIVAALRAGAAGIAEDSVSQTLSIAELIEGIRQIASGKIVIPTGLAVRLTKTYALGQDETSERLQSEGLTGREHQVLRLLAEGYSNREIASQLVLSEHTVRAHIRAIMQKLRANSRAQAVALAWKADLINNKSGKAS